MARGLATTRKRAGLEGLLPLGRSRFGTSRPLPAELHSHQAFFWGERGEDV